MKQLIFLLVVNGKICDIIKDSKKAEKVILRRGHLFLDG